MITVLLPVYNAERTLHASIKSLQNQTYKDFEIVIIDNLSTDGSYDIALHWCQRDSRISLLQCSQKGIANALNYGIDQSYSDFILRMDADDIALPSRIERQLHFMLNNPDIDLSGSLAYGFNPTNNTRSFLDVPPKHSGCLAFLKAGLSPFIHPTLIVRRKVFDRLRYDPNFGAEDLELFMRLSFDGFCFANLQERLLIYNTSSVYHGKYSSEAAQVIDRYSHILYGAKNSSLAIAVTQIQNSYITSSPNEQLVNIYSNALSELSRRLIPYSLLLFLRVLCASFRVDLILTMFHASLILKLLLYYFLCDFASSLSILFQFLSPKFINVTICAQNKKSLVLLANCYKH